MQVEAQEVGIGFHRAEIVDRHNFDILAAMLDDGAQHEAWIRPNPLIATRTAILLLLVR